MGTLYQTTGALRIDNNTWLESKPLYVSDLLTFLNNSDEKVFTGFIRPPKSWMTKDPNFAACSFEKASATTSESKSTCVLG